MNDTTSAVETKAKKTEYTSVAMTDGRIVEFAGKRKMLKSSGKGPDGNLYVRLDFVNGETRTYLIPSEDIEKYACHGAEQKYGDETAGESDVDDMIACVDALATRLQNHEWTVKREAGDGFSGAGVVIKAMCKVTGKSVDEIRAYLEKKLAEVNAGHEKAVLTRQGLYKSIRASDKFGPTIAELEAAKASKAPQVSFEDM